MSDLNEQEQAALDRVKPICDKCKHSTVDEWGEYKCHREITYSADKVSGKVWANIPKCRDERNSCSQTRCGFLGRFYEEQEYTPQSWLEKVITWLQEN